MRVLEAFNVLCFAITYAVVEHPIACSLAAFAFIWSCRKKLAI